MRFALCVIALLAAGCARQGVESLEWTAMGTIAKVSFKGVGACGYAERRRIAGIVKAVYEDVEAKLSIWRPDSELSRYAGVESLSPEMRPCCAAAFRMREESGGAFNPFWRGDGKGPDLGAIAKGFAVDIAAERLVREDAIPGGGVLLDLGGNLKVVAGEWLTGIRNPFGDMETMLLTNGMACATSGEYERGKHIKDGRTGLAVSNNLISVTVVHPSSAMIADALSTTLFILGKEKGTAFLMSRYPEARAIWIQR